MDAGCRMMTYSGVHHNPLEHTSSLEAFAAGLHEFFLLKKCSSTNRSTPVVISAICFSRDAPAVTGTVVEEMIGLNLEMTIELCNSRWIRFSITAKPAGPVHATMKTVST